MDFDEGTPPADVEELYSSWALLILTVLLIGAMWTSYYLQVRKITAIHETVISIMTGNTLPLFLSRARSPSRAMKRLKSARQLMSTLTLCLL